MQQADRSRRRRRTVAAVVATGLALSIPAAAFAERPIYIRPGAPGEPSQRISVEDLLGPSPVLTAQAEFVEHMIFHHDQALTMSDLAPDRAQSEAVVTLANRIELDQRSEINLMNRWLRLRGFPEPDMDDHHMHHDMPGMLSMEQLDELAAASGSEFDELFLEFMIFHHRGAITMVEELQAEVGYGMEPNLVVITDDIVDKQRSEISRMRALQGDLGFR